MLLISASGTVTLTATCLGQQFRGTAARCETGNGDSQTDTRSDAIYNSDRSDEASVENSFYLIYDGVGYQTMRYVK